MFVNFALLLTLLSTASAVEFQIINNSPATPVFVQLLGTQYPDPFVLQGGQQTTLTYDEPWSGRIWGRVDCYSVEECGAAGPIPASLAEITVGDGMAFYDLSLVDGFNINLSMEPVDGHGDGGPYSCQKSECAYPILDDCPEELKLYNAEHELVSCQAACNVFQTDLYCCRGEHSTPDTCKSSDWPVNYSSFFKERCPDAYCYAYDDQQSTFTCDSNRYVVTFL
ncbi:pathogenesis-related protein 5 [Asbolus verrucosus]|uniref:Pathogenesis-related protein 5 n=1 Tax=Asbolus verrucosus TaxID=1661398 RepID=A0A482W8C3_ASBVE|nr:pathogenesis-related protein 5 [Asbolus verrucosus]